MLGILVNHQQPKMCRLRNLRAMTHSSCWFSRARTVAVNLLPGYAAQRFESDVRLLKPRPSPERRSCGFTARFTPGISANGRPNSAQKGMMTFSTTCAGNDGPGYAKSGGNETMQ